MKFLNNFWVCLMLTLFLSCQTATSYMDGSEGWAWVLGICALIWLNNARHALNRDKEALDGEGRTPEG